MTWHYTLSNFNVQCLRSSHSKSKTSPVSGCFSMVSASQWIPLHFDMVTVYVSQVDLGLGWSQWSKQTRLPPEVLPIILFFTPRPFYSAYIFKGASHSRLKGVASEASEGFKVHGSPMRMQCVTMAWHGSLAISARMRIVPSYLAALTSSTN